MRANFILEHQHQGKTRKKMRVTSRRDLFVVGSSKTADLVLPDPNIGGCQFAVRRRNDDWYVCNLDPKSTAQIDNKPFVETRLDRPLEVSVGTHVFRLQPVKTGHVLFNEAKSPSTGLDLHQVVVRKKNHVVYSCVLKKSEVFTWSDASGSQNFAAPTSGQWQITDFGKYKIQQRLVASQEAATLEMPNFDHDLRKPLAITTGVFLLLASLVYFLPKPESKPQAILDKKSMEMIFDAKVLKKKKAESQKVAGNQRPQGSVASTATSSASSTAPDVATAPKVSAKTQQALTSIRQSGLSSMIGKIAKRASKQGVFVASSGAVAGTEGAGRAAFSTGQSTLGGGAAAQQGEAYRLGGVATGGKAGGAKGFKAGTGLAGAGVGTGQVSLSDEDTVIEGGLDREVIAEVINRHLGEIRYCYERQLSANRDLYGKVMVQFNITAGGDVADPLVGNTTLKNALVEGCMLRRLSGWKFPNPKGGTVVRVSYPFLFKALN